MSGRHRAVNPQRRRFGLAVVRVPVRLLARWVRAGRDRVTRAWARLIERAKERFADPDLFAGVDLDPQATSPDPVPAPTPAMEEPEPAPLTLTPGQVLPVLHTHHSHLPAAHVRWHIYDGAVAGEVNALDADEDGQRQIVAQYAKALAVPVAEHVDGAHVTVAAVGVFADVTVTVSAVLIHDDTMPLRVFEEAAADPTVGDDTLSTQSIPESALVGVGAA